MPTRRRFVRETIQLATSSGAESTERAGLTSISASQTTSSPQASPASARLNMSWKASGWSVPRRVCSRKMPKSIGPPFVESSRGCGDATAPATPRQYAPARSGLGGEVGFAEGARRRGREEEEALLARVASAGESLARRRPASRVVRGDEESARAPPWPGPTIVRSRSASAAGASIQAATSSSSRARRSSSRSAPGSPARADASGPCPRPWRHAHGRRSAASSPAAAIAARARTPAALLPTRGGRSAEHGHHPRRAFVPSGDLPSRTRSARGRGSRSPRGLRAERHRGSASTRRSHAGSRTRPSDPGSNA